MSMNKPTTLSLLPLILFAEPAAAQSLFLRPVPPPEQASAPALPARPAGEGVPTTALAANRPAQRPGSGRLTLQDASLYMVVPPKPKSFQKHDKVEIIINESAISKAEQKLETKKNYDFKAELSQFPSLQALLTQLELSNGIGTPAPSVGVNNTQNSKGEGTYERKDRLTARISALVLDVKPNGQLVLEARETIQQDNEIKTMVLSGVADPKDITTAGTLQSSQLANMSLRIMHEGHVKDVAEKGWIPRVFEAIFNF
jgi:flagellar L-ring protein precursor FlgH